MGLCGAERCKNRATYGFEMPDWSKRWVKGRWIAETVMRQLADLDMFGCCRFCSTHTDLIINKITPYLRELNIRGIEYFFTWRLADYNPDLAHALRFQRYLEGYDDEIRIGDILGTVS